MWISWRRARRGGRGVLWMLRDWNIDLDEGVFRDVEK
jgi:hypothetical protein